jgi:hypothetical protein
METGITGYSFRLIILFPVSVILFCTGSMAAEDPANRILIKLILKLILIIMI